MGHGSVLAGRYRLEERVRTGPDGSTWRAVDETLERGVIVQAFAVGHPHAAEIVDAARRAALVEDHRLQRVLAAGEERGTSYVVLEQVPGRSLAELLGWGPLPAEIARRIVGEAAEALDRASARGLHHLRLRPASLIIGKEAQVTVCGTAIDAAADGEEPRTDSAGRRADAVGLVALLYTALTGRWPGRQDAGLPRAPRVAGRPVAPADLVAGVPNDLDTVCAVSLGPHDDGPRSPGELAGQLAPWVPPGTISDPRGLQLGPGRPQLPDPTGQPADAPTVAAAGPGPAAAGTRRTPAWGLRVARLRAQGSARTVDPDGGPPRVIDLRAAEASDAVVDVREPAVRAAGSPASPGTAIPLSATPPPAGAPLTGSAPPAGPPTAATPPRGGPLAGSSGSLPLLAPALQPPSVHPSPESAPDRPAEPSPRPSSAPKRPRSWSRSSTTPAVTSPHPPVEPRDEASVHDAPAETRAETKAETRAETRAETTLDAGAGRPQPTVVAPAPAAAEHEPEAEPVPEPARPAQTAPSRRRRRTRNRSRALEQGGAGEHTEVTADRTEVLPPAPAQDPAPIPAAAPVSAPPPAPVSAPPPAPVSTPASAPAPNAPSDGRRSAEPRPTGPAHARDVRPGPAARTDRVRPAGAHAADHRTDHHTNQRIDPRGADVWHSASIPAEPISGVQALDILGAAAQPVEPVAPFGPATPLTRPPRAQSRLVVVVLAVLVLALGLFAVTRLIGFHPAPLITTGAGAPLTPSSSAGASGAAPSASGSPSATASPGAAAVSIAGAAAIDPQGDNNENGDLAKNAVDGDPSTSWHSERYDSPTFGGIKQGLGLVLDLGDTSTVTAVTLNAPGTDGTVELRTNDTSQYEGSQVVATGALTGTGKVTLTPAKPATARYLIVWFTKVPDNHGERRIVVNEVDVR